LEKNSVDIFYTYWYTEATYALQTLKDQYNYKVVTRVHGFDLYKERTFKNYMPLRKQFTKNIDKVFTITDSAIKYLVENYGYKQEAISTQRLGVKDRNIVCYPTDEKEFHIVSCSSIINVKQVDKIVDSLVILNDKSNDIKLKWTHIGDDILFENLNTYANKKLKELNIEYNLLGFLSNTEVYSFYKNNQIDVFINVSKSEGVPVSIMEAMSCHIPIVAPNIGGIPDMVINGYNGLLLKNNPSINEIVKSLENNSFFKNHIIRENSYKQYQKRYNAKINYNKFINQMVEIADEK
jgi:glycosyltransferase involved in cell wall biosynthesis